MKRRAGRLSLSLLFGALLSACAGVAPAPHPLIGQWDAEITTPLGLMTALITVRDDFSASLLSPELGEGGIDAVQVNGDAISFSTQVDAMGQAVTLSFAGNVSGDTLTGTLDTAFGPLAVNANRRSSASD